MSRSRAAAACRGKGHCRCKKNADPRSHRSLSRELRLERRANGSKSPPGVQRNHEVPVTHPLEEKASQIGALIHDKGIPMTQLPPITLRYFDARGRAQPLRYYFAARGIAYTDERVSLAPTGSNPWHDM